MVLSGKIDSVFVCIVEIVDHTVHYIRQKQIIVVVEHTNIVDNRFCAANLRLLNLDGDKEILYCEVKNDLKRHLKFESEL